MEAEYKLDLLKNSLYILFLNPSFFFKRILRELGSFFVSDKAPFIGDIGTIKFPFDFMGIPQTKKMYAEAYEFGVCEFLKENLKNGDTFIDVGANIGYISAVALNSVGREGQVHSFEPVPEYFNRLQIIKSLNNNYRIIINNSALGDKKETLKLHVADKNNIGGSTLVDNFLPKEYFSKEIMTKVDRLDDYIFNSGLAGIKIIKIDAEGFEFPVLKGLERFFSQQKDRPYIICEVSVLAAKTLNYDIDNILEYMEQFSYYPVDIVNIDKRIKKGDIIKRGFVDVVFKYGK